MSALLARQRRRLEDAGVPIFFGVDAMQNGAPDGLALIGPAGAVLQFLSYEGSFLATAGAAAGLTSLDLGVFEDGGDGTPAGLRGPNLAGARRGRSENHPLRLMATPRVETSDATADRLAHPLLAA